MNHAISLAALALSLAAAPTHAQVARGFELDHTAATTPEGAANGHVFAIQPTGQDFIAFWSGDSHWSGKDAVQIEREWLKGPLYFISLRVLDGEKVIASLSWRARLLPAAEWQQKEDLVLDALRSSQAATPVTSQPVDASAAPPVVVEIDLEATDEELKGQAEGVLYELMPGELETVGLLTTDGLALFDDLENVEDLRGFADLPLVKSVVIVPEDPAAYAQDMVERSLPDDEKVTMARKLARSKDPLGDLRKCMSDRIENSVLTGEQKQMLADVMTDGSYSKVYSEIGDEIPGFREAEQTAADAERAAQEVTKPIEDVGKDLKKLKKKLKKFPF